MKLEIALLLLAAAVCVKGFATGDDCRRRCGYGRKYVCSTDGTTYDNECMMKCNWAYKSCDGRCPCYRPPRPVVIRPRPPVVNYAPPQPVNNYEQQQSVNYYDSAPVVNYQSPPDYDPIPVYTAPEMYPAPEVYTAPEPVYYDAPGPGDCSCKKDKDYVCAYNGETYDNECEANCDGQAKMCDGKCPCS